MIFICWVLTCSDCLSKCCPKCQNSATFIERLLSVCCSVKMFAALVLVSLFSISFGSSADYLAYTSYAGLEVQVYILETKNASISPHRIGLQCPMRLWQQWISSTDIAVVAATTTDHLMEVGLTLEILSVSLYLFDAVAGLLYIET